MRPCHRFHRTRSALFAAGWTLSSVAVAQSALVHMQGDAGQREACYANFAIVQTRTPADQLLGPTSVRQLDAAVVYESPDKPEFSALRLQFEFVVKHP